MRGFVKVLMKFLIELEGWTGPRTPYGPYGFTLTYALICGFSSGASGDISWRIPLMRVLPRLTGGRATIFVESLNPID